jgi:hypothetical protein
MSEWQPIETAPRDQFVDLWHRDGFRVCGQWWDDEYSHWGCCLDDSYFTHWMPLPDPPKDST